MPTKLVYFGIQGRGQACRFLLTNRGVDFEDYRITGEEWKEAKAEGRWNGTGGLPVLVEEDGTVRNQQHAILQYLAVKHGLGPQSAEQTYEMQWFYETDKDHGNVENAGKALFMADCTEEFLTIAVDNKAKLFDKWEARWADGR